jgi:hypothetical protein
MNLNLPDQAQIQLTTADGQPIDIPIGGAIGLLALGDIGLIAWRQKRQQAKVELALRTQEHLAKDQPSSVKKTN